MAQLANIGELLHVCDQHKAREQQLEIELDQLLNSEPQLEKDFGNILRKMPDLSLIADDLKHLEGQISFTASLASRVSAKIRRLDQARAHVGECLKRVDDILELKYCTRNVQQSLQEQDYEKAAGHVHRFLAIDMSAIRASSAQGDQALLDDAFQNLHEAESSLKQLICTKFDEAASAGIEQDVQRFFKLFPLLREHELGLQKFAQYLVHKLQTEKNSEEKLHLRQLKNLYERVAQLLNEYQPVVETFYGPARLITLVRNLQTECDARAKRIVKSFHDKRNLASLQNTITRLLKSAGLSNITRLDPLELDLLLDELAQMCACSEQYLTFVLDRASKDLDAASEESALALQEAGHAVLQKIRRESEVARVAQELGSVYVLFEEYFLRESATKAIQLDDVEEPGALTSSMLGDVFFILRKCTKRAFATRTLDVLCAVLNYGLSILDGPFFDALVERIRYGYPSPSVLDLSQAYSVLQTGRYSSTDIEKARAQFLIALNNLDVACSYCESLRSSTRSQASTELPLDAQSQLSKLDSCLSEFATIMRKFEIEIRRGFTQLVASVFKPKLKVYADALSGDLHLLSDSDLLRFEASEGLRKHTQDLLVELDTHLVRFKSVITQENQDRLLRAVCDELSKRLEGAMKKCTFNKFGAYQLNRELRAILNYLSSTANWSIRDHLAKIKFIGTLLSADSALEFGELCSSSEQVHLSPGELRVLVKLRCDYKPEEIRKLKF